jgi:hypothetical protein
VNKGTDRHTRSANDLTVSYTVTANVKKVMGLYTSSECSKFTLKDTHTYRVPTRTGRGRFKLPAAGGPEGDPWPDCVSNVFLFLGSIITIDYTD